MDTCRMPLALWIKIWICLNLVLIGTKSARPTFDTSTDMGNVLVPADAEVDSVIYRLRATDPDVDFPLVFEVTATVTPVVRIENLPCTLYNKVCQANVILTRRLTAGRLHDFAVRVRDSKGDSNSMQATISVMNATTPRDKIFPHIPALIMVPEDAKPGRELDYILVRSNPWIGRPVYIELWQPKELFTIRQRQEASTTRGVITLIGELDFETQSMYTLTIYATDPYTERQRDSRNIAGLHLIVIVQDVQDMPPIFTLAPPLTKINNTVQPGDIILRVHAEDGDKGVPREITYGLVSEGNPFTPFFNITESTGEIILARPLEELTQITHVGAPIVLSVVAEEIRRSTDEPPAQATVVEVGLLLGEPGNSPPYFENDNYVAWMDENAEPGSSVVFNEPYSARVRDEDIGKAGVFALKLENNNGTFEISPAVAERTANFILTVRDNSLIDYETYKSLRFQITAQEVGPTTNLSATVPVTIFLRDINDNPPEFQEESYEVTLSENVTAGTRVTQVHATDKDTGSFGRIQYTGIIGSGSEAFVINPDTGVITVAVGTSVLDREITPQLMLTVEARDEDGNGLRGTVPFIVNLIDANDNAPVFEKDAYEFTLNSDLTNFTMPAIIKAFDADAEPPNNVIHYEIIHGNYDNKFYLDETTGELFLREQITKVRNARHNSYQGFSNRKNLTKTQNVSLEVSTTAKAINISEKNETSSKILRRKREDKNIVFTLTARAYDLGVPHLSSTTQINVLQLPLAGVTTIMLLVPGENPDREKTTKALETITGGRITIKDIRPYTLENLPKDYENNLPTPDGKKSIVVAQVEQKSPGASFVDIEKILSALTANGFGIIDGNMTSGKDTAEPRDNGGGKNGSITTIHNEEVIVYKAENKLLFWLLIILGLLILAAIITLIICCICPGCFLYMAPRKRRIHSSETLIARADNRPRRHLHRSHHNAQLESVWVEKKQAWSADPTRNNWQFNRRNTKNFGIASLPGDVRIDRDRDRQLKASSLQLHDPPVPIYLIDPSRPGDERIYVEDIEARAKGHHELTDASLRHEFDRDNDLARQVYMRGLDPQIPRESHFYRNGNAEVMRLISRDDANHITIERRPPEIIIDQSSMHRVDGKDILLRRFMEDQKLREHEFHDVQEMERQSMESHKRQKEASMQQKQEILIIPERLENHRQHIEEVGPDVQRLIIDHGPDIKGSQDVLSNILIHGSTSKISDIKEQSKQQSNLQHYSIHDLELARQNALLTRLLLEKDRGVGGVIVDSGSYLETQSLPGQVAAGTQTNQTTATQTEQLNRSRSDNESEEDGRMRRKKSKKRYDEPRRIRTLWMRSPIREEDHQYPERHGTFLRKKIKDIKDGRKSSLEQGVLREISDSLDETGDRETLLTRRHYGDNSYSRDDEMIRRDDSSSMEILKDEYTRVVRECERKDDDKKKKRESGASGKKEGKREKKTEPSFKILEREMSSLSKKLSKLAGKTLKCKEDSNQETDKFLTTDSQEKEADTTPTELQNDGRGSEKMDKIEIIKSRSRSTQRVTKSTQLKIPKETEKVTQHKSKYRKSTVMSTASSEMEEAADKPVRKPAVKKSDDEKFKFSVGKSIKSRLKRQTAVENKKSSPSRPTVDKLKKTLVKESKKTDIKSKKSTSDSSQTKGSDSKESDRDSNKLASSSIKRSSSSAVSKESRKELKEITSLKINSEEKSSLTLPARDFLDRKTAKSTTDSESIKSDKSSRKPSAESSKKSSMVTSPELGRFEESKEKEAQVKNQVEEIKSKIVEERDDLKGGIVGTIEAIGEKPTDMMEKIVDKSQKTEEVKKSPTVKSPSVKSPVESILKEETIEKEEKSQSRESVFSMTEKTIENTKEVSEKIETTVVKHVDNIKETFGKIVDEVNIIEKVKDFIVSHKGSPEHDSQTNEELIDRSSSTAGKASPKKIESPSKEESHTDNERQKQNADQKKELIDETKEIDEKKSIDFDKQELSGQQEVNKDELENVGDLEVVKSDESKQDDKLATAEIDDKKPGAESQVNKIDDEIVEEIKTEDSSKKTLSAPQIIMDLPTNQSEISKEDSAKADSSIKPELIINNLEDQDKETSNLVQSSVQSDQFENSDKLLQESKEKLKMIALKDENPEETRVDNKKAETTNAEDKKSEDTSSETKSSQLQVEESLSPPSQSSRRSSQVIISTETSFLNSPRRLSRDEKEGEKRDHSPESTVSQPEAEIPVADKQAQPSSHDTLPANEPPQSIAVEATEESGSSLPFEDKHEHSDSTFDALDDDSDVSSESSTKTAFIARPYGTPRHRRLVRMDQVHDGDAIQSPEKKIETMEAGNEEILEVSPEAIADKIEAADLVAEDVQKGDEESVEKGLEKSVEVKEEKMSESKGLEGNFDGKEEKIEEVKDSKEISGDLDGSGSKSLVEMPELKSDELKMQEESKTPEKVEINLKIDNEKLDVDSPSLTDQLESIKDSGEAPRLLAKETNNGGLKVLDTSAAKSLNQSVKRKVTKNQDGKGKIEGTSKQKIKSTIKIIPLSKGSNVRLPQKDKQTRVKDKEESIKLSEDEVTRVRDGKTRSSKPEELKPASESKVKSIGDRAKRQKRVEHDRAVQAETFDDKKTNKVSIESKPQEKSEDKGGKKKDKVRKRSPKGSSSEDQKNFPAKENKVFPSEVLGDVKEMKPVAEVSTQKDEKKPTQEKIIVTEEPGAALKADPVAQEIAANTPVKEEKEIKAEVEKEPVRVVEKEVQVAVISEPVQGMTDETSLKLDKAKKSKVITTNVAEKNTEIAESAAKKSELTSQSTKEEPKLSPLDSKQRDRSLSPGKVSKYAKEDYTEAQSRYMEWYKQNREESERRKLEKKEGEEEEQPPRWLRKSTRQRWLKMSPEDRKVFEVRTPEITPLARRKIKPLVNIESEQLKAIVRQGRKLRRAEGEKNLDPPIEIFAPEKPPIIHQQHQQPQPKYHYLLQHSEYQYQRMPPPFYLHPPPVPHPTPQVSPQRFEACQESFSGPADPHLHESISGIGTSLQTGTRLRHQQLLEKKSVFDIAYDEAAPSQLRADSTTPPS